VTSLTQAAPSKKSKSKKSHYSVHVASLEKRTGAILQFPLFAQKALGSYSEPPFYAETPFVY
jgi:hypothetical protein